MELQDAADLHACIDRRLSRSMLELEVEKTRVVMIHGVLARRNIIVQEDGSSVFLTGRRLGGIQAIVSLPQLTGFTTRT